MRLGQMVHAMHGAVEHVEVPAQALERARVGRGRDQAVPSVVARSKIASRRLVAFPMGTTDLSWERKDRQLPHG
jgi:hypothetical protein